MFGSKKKFHKLYSDEPSDSDFNVLEYIPSLVTENMNQSLVVDVKEIEIKEAVFQLGRLKGRMRSLRRMAHA